MPPRSTTLPRFGHPEGAKCNSDRGLARCRTAPGRRALGRVVPSASSGAGAASTRVRRRRSSLPARCGGGQSGRTIATRDGRHVTEPHTAAARRLMHQTGLTGTRLTPKTNVGSCPGTEDARCEVLPLVLTRHQHLLLSRSDGDFKERIVRMDTPRDERGHPGGAIGRPPALYGGPLRFGFP